MENNKRLQPLKSIKKRDVNPTLRKLRNTSSKLVMPAQLDKMINNCKRFENSNIFLNTDSAEKYYSTIFHSSSKNMADFNSSIKYLHTDSDVASTNTQQQQQIQLLNSINSNNNIKINSLNTDPDNLNTFKNGRSITDNNENWDQNYFLEKLNTMNDIKMKENSIKMMQYYKT